MEKIKQKFNQLKVWAVKHKKPLLIALAVFGALLLAGLVYLFTRDSSVDRTDSSTSTQENEEPQTKPSPLTGIEVSPELADRPVTAVVIENSPDARPQSSFDQAGVVFESIAEGGITRFVTLYQESTPEKIGPVRSVRPYFIDWFWPFDAAIAHVGGSPQGLAQIRSLGIKDLDEFANPGAYYRSTDRFAPHNVYTSTKNLDDLQKSKGFTSSSFDPWPRKDDERLETPTATKINVDISSFSYNHSYEYAPRSNVYKRSMANQPHIEAETGRQLTPKVVVIIQAPFSVGAGGYGDYNVVGSGDGLIFQDGGVTRIKWSKKDRDEMFVFKDRKTGDEVALNKGQTWISVVPASNSVTFN